MAGIKRVEVDTICEVLPNLWLRKYEDGSWDATPCLEFAAFLPKAMLEDIVKNKIDKYLKEAISLREGFPRYHTAVKSVELPYFVDSKINKQDCSMKY